MKKKNQDNLKENEIQMNDSVVIEDGVQPEDPRVKLLEEQNAMLMAKLEDLIAKVDNMPSKQEEPTLEFRKPKDGHKFIKARILDADNDLVFGIIEVPIADKRKAFDPNSDRLHNKSGAGKGNPVSKQELGPNDIQVTGF